MVHIQHWEEEIEAFKHPRVDSPWQNSGRVNVTFRLLQLIADDLVSALYEGFRRGVICVLRTSDFRSN